MRWSYETKLFAAENLLRYLHDQGYSPEDVRHVIAMISPQFMEDEDTKPATPPPAVKPHTPDHCRYAGGVPIHPPRLIDSDHSYLVAEELRSLRSHLRRNMREWPVCPWGHIVEAGFRYQTSNTPWSRDLSVKGEAVFHCPGCKPKFNGVLNMIKEEE
jgi:hypothetical protein